MMHSLDTQKWLVFFAFIIFVYLIYLLSPILTPFIISAFLAYLGDPIVDRLQRLTFSRTLSVCIVFFLMLIVGVCLLLIVVPLFEEQIMRLILRLPDIFDWLQFELLPWVSQHFNTDLSNISLEGIKKSFMGHWQTINSITSKILLKITASGQFILLWISYFLLIPVVSFYLLRDWHILIGNVSKLIPRKYEDTIVKIIKNCDAILAEFLRGQLLVMLLQGMIYSMGLWIVGLEFSLLIGLTAGLISFVPYLGFFVGFFIAGIAAFIQFNDFIHIFYVLIVFGLGQTLESIVLSPLLIGDRIGMHPIAVIFAIMAGAQLFGFFGMLLALPVAAIMTVLLRCFQERYFESRFYKV